MTASDLAGILCVSRQRVDQILKGASPITAELAPLLSHCLGTGAELWMNPQSGYDLRLAEQEISEEIRREDVLRAGIPVRVPESSLP